MELTEENIKKHPDYKMYVSNNDGIEDPNLANFCLSIAKYLLKIPQNKEDDESFGVKVIENGEKVVKLVKRKEKTFDNYSQLLEYALGIAKYNYFALYSLNKNTLKYFKIGGSVNLAEKIEDRAAEATIKEIHRNNIISQI